MKKVTNMARVYVLEVWPKLPINKWEKWKSLLLLFIINVYIFFNLRFSDEISFLFQMKWWNLTSQTDNCGVFPLGDLISDCAGVIPCVFCIHHLYDVQGILNMRLVAVEHPAEGRRWNRVCCALQRHSLAQWSCWWSSYWYVMWPVCMMKRNIFRS